MTDAPRPLPAIVDATPHALTAQPDALAPLDYLILLWLHEQASPRTRRERRRATLQGGDAGVDARPPGGLHLPAPPQRSGSAALAHEER